MSDPGRAGNRKPVEKVVLEKVRIGGARDPKGHAEHVRGLEEMGVHVVGKAG